MQPQVIRRRNGTTTNVVVLTTIEQHIAFVKEEILQAILDVSAYAHAPVFSNMKTGGPAIRANIFMRFIKSRLASAKIPFDWKVHLQSSDKLYLTLGDFKFAVSLTTNVLKKFEISVRESCLDDLKTPNAYAVDAFIVAQTNNFDKEQSAAFTVIKYDNVYDAWNNNSNLVTIDTRGVRITYKLNDYNIQSIYYEASKTEEYQNSEAHRHNEIETVINSMMNIVVDMAKKQRK